MKNKLSLMLILSLYNISYSQEVDPKEGVVFRSQREDDIQAKKARGEELTLDEEIDDVDFEIDAAVVKKSEPIPLKTQVTNYCRLLAAVCYIQYIRLKDYCGSSTKKIKEILGFKDNVRKEELSVQEDDEDNFEEEIDEEGYTAQESDFDLED